MKKMSQKEAVFQTVCNVTDFNGEGRCTPTKEQRARVNAILFMGFRAGQIELDREYSDSDLRAYVSGLQSNWLRRDERLNGGKKYTAKNPGSRTNSSDPMLKSLRALLATVTTDADKAEIQGYIDARMTEIASAKRAVSVDLSALPADLATKFSK